MVRPILDVAASGALFAPKTCPVAAKHKGEIYWLSYLPSTPGSMTLALCAWRPSHVLEGLCAYAEPKPGVKVSFMSLDGFRRLLHDLDMDDKRPLKELMGVFEEKGYLTIGLRNKKILKAKLNRSEEDFEAIEVTLTIGKTIPGLQFQSPTFSGNAFGMISDARHILMREPHLDKIGLCLAVPVAESDQVRSGFFRAKSFGFSKIKSITKASDAEEDIFSAWKFAAKL